MTPTRPRIGILTIDSAISRDGARLLVDRLGSRVAFVGLSNLYRRGGGGTPGAIARHVRRGGWAWLRFLIHAFTLPMLTGAVLGPFFDRFRTLRQYCRRRGVPVFTVDEAGSAHFLNGREAEADLIVSIYFDQILGAAAIGACERAATPVINVHTARLPAHRGPAPVLYSLLDDPPTLGCTVHRIASTAIDAGPVIAVRMAEPLPGESVLSASARLHALGAEMVLEIVGDLARSLDQATAQSAAGASYEGFPDRAVLAAARARGIRLV